MRNILALVSVLFLLSVPSVMAQEPCEADFNCDQNVDASDVDVFLADFGRSPFNDPCPDCYDSPCPCSTVYTCGGTLSAGGRWCDQGDGTVKDMTTGLVWLKKADWGGLKAWSNCSTYDDAHTRAGILYAGMSGAELSDGSVEGDWRLPTKTEHYNLANGTEAVRSSSMQLFTGVQPDNYWSSTTSATNTDYAWNVYMYNGYVNLNDKAFSYNYVWCVRSGQ